jgi:hypothetical protein
VSGWCRRGVLGPTPRRRRRARPRRRRSRRELRRARARAATQAATLPGRAIAAGGTAGRAPLLPPAERAAARAQLAALRAAIAEERAAAEAARAEAEAAIACADALEAKLARGAVVCDAWDTEDLVAQQAAAVWAPMIDQASDMMWRVEGQQAPTMRRASRVRGAGAEAAGPSAAR